MNPNQISPHNRGFAIAAFVCGILSVATACCYLSIPFGAMGILFYCLNRRKGRPVDTMTQIGLWCSVFGCAYGIFSIVYLFKQLQDPAFVASLNEMCIKLYGMDLQQLMEYYTIPAQQ